MYASAIGIYCLNVPGELCSQNLRGKYVRIKLGFNCIHFQPNGVPSTTAFSEIYDLDTYTCIHAYSHETHSAVNNKALLLHSK